MGCRSGIGWCSGWFVYDYDDYCDDSPDYFDYDEPGHFDGYPDMYGFIGPDDYELCHDLHGPDDCGTYCVSREDAGVMSYGTGAGDGDIYENAIAMQ